MILADQLSAYAVKLLDKVRGHVELDCVLGKTGKESEEKYVLLARLYLAIKYEEKPVGEHGFRSKVFFSISFSLLHIQIANKNSWKSGIVKYEIFSN